MPTKFFGTVRPKIFIGKTWYTLVYMKFFDIPTFLKQWDQKFSPENEIHPNMPGSYSIPQIFWNFDGMSTKSFGTVRQFFFDGNLCYPLLCLKFFDNPIYLKHWTDAQEIFRHCETKFFRREKRHTLYYTWNFSIPRFLWKIEGMATKFFVTVTPKIFDGKTWYPTFSSTNPFGNKIFCQKQLYFWTNFFGSVRHKDFDWKSWFAPSCP